MTAASAFPGLILCLAATILLVFVSVSPPTWNTISFLDVSYHSELIKFGVFGHTGSHISIGYDIDPAMFGLNANIDTTIVHHLTKVLILHPIAAGISGLAFVSGMFGACYHRAGTVVMALLAALATLTTLVAFVVDMVLFGIARKHFRDDGAEANYGNANWLAAGALVALVLGFCGATCGVFGRYRRRRSESY